MARKITPKMLSFVDAYFGEANFNGKKAYELSAYESKTTSKATLDKTVSELLAHPLVQQEIKKRQAQRQQVSEVKAEYLLNKLMNIIDDSEGIEKTADRLRAIELAGKAIALWKERQEISGPDGDAIKHEQHVKESVADFTNRIQSLTRRATGTDDPRGAGNVVEFPNGRGEG